MSLAARGPQLRRLTLADRPEAWARLGFRVSASRIELGGVDLALGAAGQGIVGWALAGVDESFVLDGLPVESAPVGNPGAAEGPGHPNGAIGIDHVVLLTPAFEQTAAALEQAGMPLRRIRETPQGVRQGFRRLGPAILELVHAPKADRLRLWGLVVIVEDLERLAQRLGGDLGPVKPAVQPGRRIATLRPSGGLTAALAFMDPPPAG